MFKPPLPPVWWLPNRYPAAISRGAMSVHEFLTFASEADIVGLWGLAMLVLAVVSLIAERRRMKRTRIDRIGWVPWTNIFMISAIIGMGLLALAAKGILAG
ncbi:MAG: hypothetical protein WBH10_09585 [Allopontixanthobacter sediminis]